MKTAKNAGSRKAASKAGTAKTGKHPWCASSMPVQPLQAPQHILIYPGEHTAYLVRMFTRPENMFKFMAANQLRNKECTRIVGKVEFCDRSYRSLATYKQPWDEGEEPEVTRSEADEMCTTSQPLGMEEVRKLLGG